MPKNNFFRLTRLLSIYPYSQWTILALFSLLTVIMLYPLSLRLASMVPEPTDPLLNVWRMQWNAHAFLSGPTGLANLFNTNIFYPFPLTLAYSEHFLMITAQALPFLLLTDSHMVGMNLSVLVTFALSGYAMYLLVTGWTGRRWAGLVAGVLFAFSPQRFGQLNHLELLVTQWFPLTLLALHWTLTRPGRRYAALFIIFFNLQALSGFHYSFNLALACALLTLVYAVTRRVCWRRGLWLAGGLSIGVTLLLNWPVWQMYLRFSDVMGAIRTPGEVRVYSAALTDYLTSIPHNLIYGKLLGTFGRWQPAGHQFQVLLPVGVVGLVLAILGLLKVSRGKYQVSRYAFPTILFLALLTLTFLLLSFGLNDEALGPGLSPVLKYSPYAWLYNHVTLFQGIRVPGRYGIMVVVGLVGLAGWGAAYVLRFTFYVSRLGLRSVAFILTALILLESWSAPLTGGFELPGGTDIPPVYSWLLQQTPADAVALELPYQGASEFIYEYYSSYHWRRLANGGTGFTPPIYKELRQWFNAFPDARSVDVIQQLGIDVIILHADSYRPEDWQRVQADLPLYLSAFEQIDQVGNALVLRVTKPTCPPKSDLVQATVAPAELDGLPNAAQVNYHNSGPAAFVADVAQVSQLTFAAGRAKNFTEPLVTPANESQAVLIPLSNDLPSSSLTGARLASLNHAIQVEIAPSAPASAGEINWQPLGLRFADGPQLVAYMLNPDVVTTCGYLTMNLQWANGQPGDTALVQLLDPFGRIVLENSARPWVGDGSDTRRLALPGSLPPGRYGLRVRVKTNDGTERPPVTEQGVTIPPDKIPPLPLVIHPAARPVMVDLLPTPAVFGNAIGLVGAKVAQKQVTPGNWLRFTLVWQTQQPLNTDLTVFTQLLGSDGQVWGQRDNQPGGGWYSTSLWQPGQPVVDDYAFQIQPGTPPGVYRLIVGLYHPDTQQRLSLPNGQDFVEIGTVTIK